MWPFQKKDQQIATLLVYSDKLWLAQWTIDGEQFLINNIAHQQFDHRIFYDGICFNLSAVHNFMHNIGSCKQLTVAVSYDSPLDAPHYFQSSLMALNSSFTLIDMLPMHEAEQISLGVHNLYDEDVVAFAYQNKNEFDIKDCLLDKKDSKKYGKYKDEILISKGLVLNFCKKKAKL